MGLRLIYGKAGSGKSQYCLNKIKENIDNPNKIYMITPEQFSYMQERKMLDVLTTNAVMKAEVLTFARMAHRVFQKERWGKGRAFKSWKSHVNFSFATGREKKFDISK
ncbi:MAG: hypothetical protein HFJ27_03645 [Clostridia bacterium]|nr:hypothetical protein [Clostridia bacterium]